MAETKARPLPLNFLLSGSLTDLDNFRLKRMEAAANIRSELHTILDRLLDEMNQAALAMCFSQMDRAALKSALENEETALEWARRMIRGAKRLSLASA